MKPLIINIVPKPSFQQLPNEIFCNILEFLEPPTLPILLKLNKVISNNIKLGEFTQPFIKEYEIVLLDRLHVLLKKNAYHPRKGLSLPLLKFGLSLFFLLLQLGILVFSGIYVDKGRVADNASYNECAREFNVCGCNQFVTPKGRSQCIWTYLRYCTYVFFDPSQLACENISVFKNATLFWNEAKTNYSIGLPTLFVGSFFNLAFFGVYTFILYAHHAYSLNLLPDINIGQILDFFGFCSRDPNKFFVKIDLPSRSILKQLQHYDILNTIKTDKNFEACKTTIDNVKTEIQNQIGQLKSKSRASFFLAKKESVREAGVYEDIAIEIQL